MPRFNRKFFGLVVAVVGFSVANTAPADRYARVGSGTSWERVIAAPAPPQQTSRSSIAAASFWRRTAWSRTLSNQAGPVGSGPIFGGNGNLPAGVVPPPVSRILP